MLISELVKELVELMAQEGDIDITIKLDLPKATVYSDLGINQVVKGEAYITNRGFLDIWED